MAPLCPGHQTPASDPTTRHGDLRIVVYTAPPGSEAASKLALLATIGTQPMAPASAGTD